jgi:hypothetical protein
LDLLHIQKEHHILRIPKQKRANMATPHPTVDQLRPLVKRVPADGALFGEGTLAVPSEKEGELTDFIVDQSIADGVLASAGRLIFHSFTFHDKHGQPYAGGIKVTGKRFTKNLYLLDGEGKELACMIEQPKNSAAVLSTRPFFPRQDVSPLTVDNQVMYDWCKISNDDFGTGVCTVELPSTKGGFVVGYTTHSHISPEDLAKGHTPIISVQQAGGAYVALIKDSKRADIMAGPCKEVLVSPGMDPCLVIFIVTHLMLHIRNFR